MDGFSMTRPKPALMVLLPLLLLPAAGCGTGDGEKTPAPANPQAAAQTDAQDLVGTRWQAGEWVVALQANGQAQAAGKPGEWTYNAGQVSVRTDDAEYRFVARGDALWYGDMAFDPIR